MDDLQSRIKIEQGGDFNPMRLIDEYSDSLYKFCHSLVYSKEDAEDLFQETFLRALEQPKKIEASHSKQGFLFSTALYIWKSWKRKYARRKRIVPTEPLNEMAASDIDIEASYLKQEENLVVRKLVEELPEKLKIPTILYYTLEMSVDDVSETLNIPTGTVKSRLYKARKNIEKGLISNEY